MNFKKLAVTAATGAVMLAAVAPAFAWSDNVLIVKNKAKVKNFTLTVANTGMNSINADDDVEGGKIKTGNAEALASVSNTVNFNAVDTCGCEDESFTLIKNKAKVKNVTLTVANSGMNRINADEEVDGGRIRTGGAGSVSVVENNVNTNFVGGSLD